MGAYQLILDNEKSLSNDGISKSQKGSFNYLKSFTYMSIGDLETAQKSYYNELEIGRADNDTSAIIRSLYSLGQLYNDENEYLEAIDCFSKVLKYKDFLIETRPSTLGLVYIELGETYSNLKEFDKSIESLGKAWSVTQEYNIKVLKSDVLMLKGNVYLGQGRIDSAEYVYNELVAMNISSNDQNNIKNSKRLLAQIYREKKRYSQALRVYEDILAETDSGSLEGLMETYANAHEVCGEIGDHKSAYTNLLAYNEVKNKKR